MRNLLALSAGVEKTLYWDLLDAPGQRDDLMTLMYGKIGLLGVENDALQRRTLTAEVFARMTSMLAGVRKVTRVIIADQPSLFLFEIARELRATSFVAWERRDAFSGEEAPPKSFDWSWSAPSAIATDVFGTAVPTRVHHGRLELSLSLTPVYIEPGAE